MIALVRRPLDLRHAKLDARVVDFDALDQDQEALRGDDVFCCLGTTIKKAGSERAFKRVDHDYVAALAQLTREQGARTFSMVSSIGADPESNSFYLGTKGRAEASVTAAGFDALHIFRPSLLLGDRQESRPAESASIFAMRWLGGALLGPLRPYRGVEAGQVAAAMIKAAIPPSEATSGSTGTQIYSYDQILQLAQG